MSKEANKFTGSNRDSLGVPAVYHSGDRAGFMMANGIFLAKVVDVASGDYDQAIYVELVGQQTFGDRDTREQRHQFQKVRTVSPFGGTITGRDTTVSYGSCFPPPGPGTEVLVGFTGNDSVGFLLGVLPQTGRNSSVPGLPVSQIEGEQGIGASIDPGADQDQNIRPRHPVANAVAAQGLGLDPARGIGSSGSRRESPTNVAGFLTPGGHSFVMDDGTVAYKEGENYVPDQSRKEGQSNLMRLRSAGGAQMLFNDTEGIVYINNQNGSSWIQMDSDGNVDIYAQGSISYHTEQDFNLYAGGDINLDADTFNIKARGAAGIQAETATGPMQFKSNKDIRLTTDLNLQLKAGGYGRISTDGMLDLNGPTALGAVGPTSGSLASNRTVKESINPRVPEHEPWGGHTVQADTQIAAQAPASAQTTAKDYDVSNVGSTLSVPEEDTEALAYGPQNGRGGRRRKRGQAVSGSGVAVSGSGVGVSGVGVSGAGVADFGSSAEQNDKFNQRWSRDV